MPPRRKKQAQVYAPAASSESKPANTSKKQPNKTANKAAKGSGKAADSSSSKGSPANATAQQRAKTGKKVKVKRPPLPVECDTPVPLLTNFTHPIPSTAVRTGDDEARLAEHHSRQAQLFLENADVFGAPFVLEELRSSRSKNTEEGKLQAQETIDSLSNQAPQTLSSIIVDQRGQIVVAYMGKRVKKPLGPKLSDNSEKAMRQRLLKRAKPLCKQYEGRTAKDAPEDVEYTYDGVEPNIVQRTYEATQYLAAFHRPLADPKDIRHAPLDSGHDPRVVEYPTIRLDPPDLTGMGTRLQNVVLGRAGQKRKREATLEVTRKVEGAERRAPGIGVEPDKTYFCPVGKTWERAGVMHLVHSWHQQGTAAGDLIAPSKDMVGSSGQALQVNVVYFKATREFAIIVAEYFKILFPSYYEKYKKDFDAGFWEAADPGPFLGRAVVFKLQVYVHQDGLDRGPTVSVPAGYFTGGALHFPDLEAVFAYGPGDLCFSMSADLYHAVDRWEAAPVPSELAAKHITPGRVSTVFFCPEKTAQTLAGKPANWNRDTAGGITPNASGKGQDSSIDKVDEPSETDNESADEGALPSSRVSGKKAAREAKKRRRTRMRGERDSQLKSRFSY